MFNRFNFSFSIFLIYLFFLGGLTTSCSQQLYHIESNVQRENEEENINNISYTSKYKKTSKFQSTVLTIGAAFTSILNPRRHDMIAVLGETTGHAALSRMYKEMKQNVEGSMVLKNRPRINTSTVDVEALSNLPVDTLGYTYSQFLSKNDVTPDSRLPVQFVSDPELAFVMQRYRETHDLVHATLGMPTTMLGEVAVKWVEALQTGLPMCIAGALIGPVRLKPKHRLRYLNEILPWALQVGRQAKPFINIYFEQRWEQRLDEFRREFNISPPPL